VVVEVVADGYLESASGPRKDSSVEVPHRTPRTPRRMAWADFSLCRLRRMSVGLEGSDDVEEVVRVETSERARQSMEAREKERVGLWGGGGGAERVGGGGAREKGILVDVNVLVDSPRLAVAVDPDWGLPVWAVARGAVGEINSKAIKTKWQKLSERDKRQGIYGRNRSFTIASGIDTCTGKCRPEQLAKGRSRKQYNRGENR
jgi:hypothetical protein